MVTIEQIPLDVFLAILPHASMKTLMRLRQVRLICSEETFILINCRHPKDYKTLPMNAALGSSYSETISLNNQFQYQTQSLPNIPPYFPFIPILQTFPLSTNSAASTSNTSSVLPMFATGVGLQIYQGPHLTVSSHRKKRLSPVELSSSIS